MTKRSKIHKSNYLFNFDDNSFIALHKEMLQKDEVWSINFGEYEDSYQDFTIYTDRKTLKRMAEFINNYLENK